MNKELIKIAKKSLQILSTKPWQILSLEEIEKKSNVKLFNKLIKNKQDLLNNINAYFDYILSIKVKHIEDSNNKDMIFEILMMRFDILQINRKSIISIYKSFKNKPQELIFLLPQLVESIALIFLYAKIPTKGIVGQIKITGILIIYISTFFIWIKDESLFLEKTMTALDGYLENAGDILKYTK